MSNPVTQADYEAVARLHAEGMGRNEICKQLGRSGKTVSKLAAAQGLTFERSGSIAAATEAKKVDAAALRAQLALNLLHDAARLREQLFAPAKAFNFGGKENTFNDTTLDEPTFVDKRNIIQACAQAIQASLRIDEYDRLDTTLSGVDEYLAHLAGDDS